MASSSSIGSELEPGDTAVIKEIYDSENAQEIFEIELERALQVGCRTIVIEPTKLAEETSRWILTGNVIHRVTIISGFSAIVTGLYFWDKPLLSFPFGMTSGFCATLYLVAWQFDPCVKYRLGDYHKNFHHAGFRSRASGPVLLVRKEKQTAQSIFHTTIAATAFTFCLWRLWADD